MLEPLLECLYWVGMEAKDLLYRILRSTHVVASRPVANQLDIIGYLLREVSVPNSFLSPSENTPKFVDKTLPTF